MTLTLVSNGNSGLTARTNINAGLTQQNNLGFLNARDLGAVGDNAHDDTAALQNAINAAIAAKKSLYVPAGRYLLSAGLTVDTAGNTDRGFQMYGDGDGIDGNTGGTVFAYTGASAITAVFSILSWRNAYFHDLSVTSTSTGIPTYGFLCPDSALSACRMSRVSANFVSRAFGILAPTGSNGENWHLDSCLARNVDCFWYSEAGQAYGHSFVNCGGILNAGGTYFLFNLTSAGGGIDVWHFNATGNHGALSAGQSTNTTLVKTNGGPTSFINFWGGRIEWLTALWSSANSSFANVMTPQFYGMQFTVDNYLAADGNATNTINAFINGFNHRDVMVIRSCNFEGISGVGATAKLNIITGYGQQQYVLFENCVFMNMVNPALAPYTNERLVGCIFKAGSTVTLQADTGTWT